MNQSFKPWRIGARVATRHGTGTVRDVYAIAGVEYADVRLHAWPMSQALQFAVADLRPAN